MRVPMIVSWATVNPANQYQAQLNIPQASVEHDMVAVWDILPTVLDIADVAPPHVFDGHNLSPYLRNIPGTHRPQELLIYLPIDHRSDFFSVYRQDNWKLIYFFPTDTYSLYNLDTDPTEQTNVAASNPERVMSMARRMAQTFDGGWGIRGVLWPRFTSNDSPDPLTLPNLPLVDVDGDGVADLTEDANGNGLVDAGETDPDNNNSDGDNVTDGEELELGTDPLDASDAFAVDVTTGSANMNLTWPSQPGSLFLIEKSTNLSNWTTVADDVPADGSLDETSYQLPLPTGQSEFYRVTLK